MYTGGSSPSTVVKLRIKKYDVERVIIDPGRAANIMYYEAFQKLRFESEDLKLFFGTLVNFTNRETTPRSYVEAETVFGEGHNMTKAMLRYLVIECTSPYNVEIGLPAINNIGAVVSPMHLEMKYPTPYGNIGVLAGEQKVANSCVSECEERYVKWGPRAAQEGNKV